MKKERIVNIKVLERYFRITKKTPLKKYVELIKDNSNKGAENGIKR